MLKNVIFYMKCDDNKLLSTCNFRYSTLELNYNRMTTFKMARLANALMKDYRS